MEIIENVSDWRERYQRWNSKSRPLSGPQAKLDSSYPFVKNKRAPFLPLRRALPMLNLALVSSAGAYIKGTKPFDTETAGGDASFREIPTVIAAEDLGFAARGYSPDSVLKDINSQIPLERLFEFEDNGIVGSLAQVFWSFCGFIPDSSQLLETLPAFVARVKRYGVQAALLVPASSLCHQSMALAARALEIEGIPTMMLVVDHSIAESVRPPRAGYYKGEFGSVSGHPNWPEHQRRVLDEALRLMEPMDQPSIRNLVVELETTVEIGRGEK